MAKDYRKAHIFTAAAATIKNNFLLHYFAVEFAAVARTRALKERRARDKSAAAAAAAAAVY